MGKVVKASKANIRKAAKIIWSNGLVIFPTETVYGLGADALNPDAVVKIFEVKKRPKFDPIIVHIAELKSLKHLCKDVNRTARKLIKRFWPGPLTIVFKKTDVVPDIVTSGMDTVGIRMPSHPVALELIKKARCPIAAPSANEFGYITPTKAKNISKQLQKSVGLILDSGKTCIGIESTVISVIDKPIILRSGAITKEAIEEVIGPVEISKFRPRMASPGQLDKHYAPVTKMEFLTKKTRLPENKKLGLIVFKDLPQDKSKFKVIEVLSKKGDLHEAAHKLFGIMFKMDKKGMDKIYVEKVPEKGIGIAIMERLRKATYKRSNS